MIYCQLQSNVIMHYEYSPSWRLKESVHARIQNVLLDGIQFLPPPPPILIRSCCPRTDKVKNIHHSQEVLFFKYCPFGWSAVFMLANGDWQRFYYSIRKPSDSLLTHIITASFLWDIGKLYIPRSDATQRGVWWGPLLFAHRMFY